MEEENSIADSSVADSSLTINSTFSKALCIFCASVCPASFTVLDGKVIRIKEEDDDEGDKQEEIPRTNGEDVVLERQLRSMFIVRKILDVRASSCAKFLKEFEGQLDPEYWINVCSECKSPVYDYYQAVMQINNLEVKMKHIKIKLKELITKSFGKNEENGTAEGITTTIWRGLREEAINGTNSSDDDDKHSEEYFDAKEEPESHSSSMMEVDYDPTLVKFEMETSTATEDGEAYETVTESISPLVTGKRRGSTQRKSKISSRESIEIERKTNKSRITRLQLQPSASTSRDVKPRLNGLSTPLSLISESKPNIVYKCEDCNALIENQTRKLQMHEQLHKTEGKGKKCKQCGWLVNYMAVHLNTWHSKKTAKMLRGNFLIRSLSERKKDHSVVREMDSSHHNYVICRQFLKTFYKCRHCPGLKTLDRKAIEEHSNLHDSHDHGATICDSCGWLIAEGKMRRHQAKRHDRNSRSFIETPEPVIKVEDQNETEGDIKSVSILSLIPTPTVSLPKFFHRCEECGEGFKTIRRLRIHQHEEASLNNNSLTLQESLVVASPATTLTLDVKPFTCNQCEKTFSKKSGLQTHIKIRHKLTVLPDATVNENESNESTNAQSTDITDIEVNGVTEDEVASSGSTIEAASVEIKDVVSEPTSEVDSEPSSDLIPEKSSDVIPEATSEVVPEATSKVLPEATSEVVPEATSEVLPEATSEVVPEATSEGLPEATSEVVPEATSEVLPEATSEIVPNPKNGLPHEPTSELPLEPTSVLPLEPISEVLPSPTNKVVLESTSEVVLEPTSEVVLEPTSEVVLEPTSEVVLEPTSEVVPEPISELSPEQTNKDVSQPTQEVASGSIGQVTEACKNVRVPSGDAINLNGSLETK